MIPALEKLTAVAPFSRETGRAFNIRCTPDLFTGETLNVGVCIIGTNGQRLCKIIDLPGRLACLYGDAGALGIVQLAQIAMCSALEGDAPPSPNIIFDTPTPIYNLSPLEALDDLFSSQVTVAIAQHESNRKRLPIAPTNKVIAELYNHLRLKNSEAANRIIPQSLQTVINTRKGKRPVQIALQPEGGGGIVESAAYAPGTIRNHLLNALLDLEWAAEARGLSKLGFFIMRPGNWPEARQLEADQAIDHVIDRIPTRIRVEVEADFDVMTEHVLDWSQTLAA